MNGQMSLLCQKLIDSPPHSRKSNPYKVYIEDQDGNTYSTKLQADVQTIYDAIQVAVNNFNQNLHAGLPTDPELYELYAAKHAKKDTGLPSFEKTQLLEQVGKNRFYLMPIARECRFLSQQSLNSIKPIEVDFSARSKKRQSHKEKPLFCLCGGW